jgi:hypothetical protein
VEKKILVVVEFMIVLAASRLTFATGLVIIVLALNAINV